MEIQEPEEKEKKVEEIKGVVKKEKTLVPEKEKLIDKIIFLLFRRPSNDPDVQMMMRGLADIALR